MHLRSDNLLIIILKLIEKKVVNGDGTIDERNQNAVEYMRMAQMIFLTYFTINYNFVSV